jgi:hypothetical protein
VQLIDPRRVETATRYFALIAGGAFLLAAVGGFLPGLTLAPLPPDAPHLHLDWSYGLLLGLFPVNGLHNLFHLAVGLGGVAAFPRYATARRFAQALAVALGLLTLLGLIPGLATLFGLLPLFGHDIWLHGLEAGLAGYLGFIVKLPAPVPTSVPSAG